MAFQCYNFKNRDYKMIQYDFHWFLQSHPAQLPLLFMLNDLLRISSLIIILLPEGFEMLFLLPGILFFLCLVQLTQSLPFILDSSIYLLILPLLQILVIFFHIPFLYHFSVWNDILISVNIWLNFVFTSRLSNS